jgi:uncharacterized SAM-binding protein YcdF (DUF218 family)
MPTDGADTDDGMALRRAERSVAVQRPLLRRLGWTLLVLGAVTVLMLGLDFVWFLWRVPTHEVALRDRADGIVALTGGASRITDAMELLASGGGSRLLISGANPTTTSHEISRLNPEYEHWVRCCVDVDRAVNTLGNAIETRHWAERRGFRSLIVVTSNYHMPRALAEFANQLPQVTLVPFPVITDRQRAEPWWANTGTTRLMFTEYVKYVFARIRIGLHPGVGELS